MVDLKHLFRRNIKVLKSIMFFNTAITIGYIIACFIKGTSPWDYVVYINLKVYMLTYFVFWYFSRVSIIEFFAFSKDMGYLLTITMSQIFSYKKTFEDFRSAFRARVVSLRDKEKIFIKQVFSFFLSKSIYDSKEKSLSMKARGFFDE